MAEPSARPPLLRYPFLWAFLAGIIALTLIRPCLRRVPGPPPVTGRFPESVLVGRDGRPFGRDTMRGEVWIVALLRHGCGEPCDGASRRLREVDETYTALRVGGIRILEVVAGGTVSEERAAVPGAGPARRVVASGGPDVVRDLASTLCAAAEPAPPGCLVIVDAGGNLRGHYPADADGFNEVYNRARHVRDAPTPGAGEGAGGDTRPVEDHDDR
jgi:hypothetical protein